MITIFPKIHAECETCGMKLFGEDLDHIGDRFYCRSDYDKELEKPENEFIRRNYEYATDKLGIDSTQLALNHDFTNWTMTNATATSAKVFTGSAADSEATKNFNLEFGKWYEIKVTASANSGDIVCYNSTAEDATLLGANSFENRFVALTDYIEFRNATQAVNTVSLIELRKL